MPSFYLNNYHPLVGSVAGKRAVEIHGLPPFIDGSIRREPDLEHVFPAITCLCRGGQFAPRLDVGDVVAYVTRKGRYASNVAHRRLTAILRVTHAFDSHEEAADWYVARKLSLPSNLMVPDNPPRPFEQSHQLSSMNSCLGDEQQHRAWNEAYLDRSQRFPLVRICEPVGTWLDWDAPIVHDADLVTVFGKIPGLQNPGRHPLDMLTALCRRLKLDVRVPNS